MFEFVVALEIDGWRAHGRRLDAIAADEPGDRGLYGGPTGWVDGAGNGEFAVAIRSGVRTPAV